ncbi:MAG: DUF368 domain-containing protein [Spirochaetota bacterium]
MNTVIMFIRGIVIGVANLIPGVSGGTMALILGIYERMISALHNISLSTVTSFFGLLRFSKESRKRFADEMQKIDFVFLLTVFMGAATAAALFVKLMVHVLSTYHDPTYGFFFGLVLPSVYVPFREVKNRSRAVYVCAVLAALLVIGSDSIVSDRDVIAKEQARYELELREQSADSGAVRATFTVYGGVLLAASGALAVSAMILPGISGSFVLLLLGQYFVLLEAVSEINIPYLALFMAGVVAGLLLFTRFLHFLLKKFHDTTMGFLTGLVAGSLWIIWPFKESVQIGTSAVKGYPETVYLSNTLPSAFGMNEAVTVISCAAGVLIVCVMIRIEERKNISA